MYTRDTLFALSRTLLHHALLFATIQVALSVSRIYSVLPGFRLLGTVTSVPGPETTFSCCIECARGPANCDASHFNTLTEACELVVYSADPQSIEAASEWVLYYSSSLNLSLNFGANASQTSLWKPAHYAIDGDRTPYWNDDSCTGTHPQDWSPWWQVDLAVEMPVDGMLIWNRLDGEGPAARLSNITIYVSPTYAGLGDARYVCEDLPDPPDPLLSNPIEVTCARRMAGRYIRIHKTHDRYLHLCEVELILL